MPTEERFISCDVHGDTDAFIDYVLNDVSHVYCFACMIEKFKELGLKEYKVNERIQYAISKTKS